MPAGVASLPFASVLEVRTPAALVGDATADFAIGVAGAAGAIVSATFIPDATITGVVTNNFSHSIINKGQAGAGTAVMATLNYTNGVNATAFDEKTIPLTAVVADLDCVAGDVIALRRTLVGTGLATPAGVVRVRIGAA